MWDIPDDASFKMFGRLTVIVLLIQISYDYKSDKYLS